MRVTESSAGFESKTVTELYLVLDVTVREVLPILLEKTVSHILFIFSCGNCMYDLTDLNIQPYGLAWLKVGYTIETELPKLFQTQMLGLGIEQPGLLPGEFARLGIEHVNDSQLQRYSLNLQMFCGNRFEGV